MINLFCGFDRREEPGSHVFLSSVMQHAADPLNLIPLTSRGLAQGTNEFTLSRFLAPSLCGFAGHSIFVDGADMIMLDDIAKLDALFDAQYAVQVVKHADYTSRHARKYIGTALECEQSNYARKNWASVMLFNNEHPAWRELTRVLSSAAKIDVLQFRFLENREIGSLPPEWNVIVDEGHEHPEAKILHWTAGIPFFPHYADAPRAAEWRVPRGLVVSGPGG